MEGSMYKIDIGGPPAHSHTTKEAYTRGYDFARDAINRYGNDACKHFRASQIVGSSYDQGAADCFDGKANRYES